MFRLTSAGLSGCGKTRVEQSLLYRLVEHMLFHILGIQGQATWLACETLVVRDCGTGHIRDGHLVGCQREPMQRGYLNIPGTCQLEGM
jgi:hypothetical protein